MGEHRDEPGVSRRAFIFGGAAFVAALADLPRALTDRGWFTPAHADDLDLTRDTLNGLVAFVVPGPDAYSRAQGEWTREPGGIAPARHLCSSRSPTTSCRPFRSPR